jgi:hypothetical protein
MDLLYARWQMGLSLAFHIVFAVIGMAMPVMMVAAEVAWLRTRRPEYLDLAKRWALGTAILFAVGAVSGTVLSFELGLLWPAFMEAAGPILGHAEIRSRRTTVKFPVRTTVRRLSTAVQDRCTSRIGLVAWIEFDSEITLCCKLLKTQGKCRGWEAGIRTPIVVQRPVIGVALRACPLGFVRVVSFIASVGSPPFCFVHAQSVSLCLRLGVPAALPARSSRVATGPAMP